MKAIGAGGTSLFSSDLLLPKNATEEIPLHEQWLIDHDLKDEDKITDDVWFTMYGQLVTQFELQQEANQKMK